jgi:signal peptidase II
MSSTAPRRVTISVLLLMVAFAADRVTKQWALRELNDGSTIELGLGARLELIFNPGVAFGLGADLGPPLAAGLIILASVLTAWVLWRAARGAPMGGTSLLALAAGGAAGNIWDRISRAAEVPLSGEVVDFLAVDGFAIFNVADIFTTCGVAGWALLQVFRSDDAPTPTPPNP